MDPRQAYDEEERRKKALLIVRRRRVRDLSDPFDMTVKAFTGHYRLTQDLVRDVMDLTRDYVRRTTSSLAVPFERKLLCVLSFYATGSYQMPTGTHFDFAIAQPTVSGFIDEVTNALLQPGVVSRLVCFPRTKREQKLCVQRNSSMGGRMPNVAGYIDGTLVKIRKPSLEDNRHAFMGRKSYASINVQFVCDKRLYFLDVLARYPGSTNDSFIFHHSAVKRKMVELHDDLEPIFLLGDSGYHCEPWLLTPFARADEPEADTPQARYNTDHCFDRNAIERAIGVWKAKFRCINDERVLHYHHMKAFKFCVATTVLHNLCILANNAYYLDALNDVNPPGNALHLHDLAEDDDYWVEEDSLVQGARVRQEVVQFLEDNQNGA